MTRSESMLLKWGDPVYRAKMVAAQLRSWAPSRKAAASARMLGIQPTPATVDKIAASNRKTWEENHAKD